MDYFGVTSAAVLGVSFGGYLVMRAAAYCPRITRVIAFDMMYRLLDGLTMPLPRPLRPIAEAWSVALARRGSSMVSWGSRSASARTWRGNCSRRAT